MERKTTILLYGGMAGMIEAMKHAKKQKPGPREDHLKIDGDWKDAAKQALSKEKPTDGWPEPEEGKGKVKDD